MSVIKKDNTEIKNLINHLFLYPNLVEDTKKMPAFNEIGFNYNKTDEDKKRYVDIYIITLFDRLFLANQLAFDYGYDKNINIKRLDFDFDTEYLAGDHITPQRKRDFHNELGSLKYNLYTNNGRSFVSTDDLEVLSMLIEKTEEWGKWLSVEEKKKENAFYRLQD